ncbi:phosphatase PAP2 family protein [Blastococcus sp. SYSU D00820]
MTSGVVRRDPGTPPGGGEAPAVDQVTSVGRPPWWLLGLALLVTVGVTVDLLRGGVLETLDERVSDVVGGWGLRTSDGYWPVWAVTQIGGRGTILIVLAGLVTWLAVRRRSLLPLVRVVVGLALLTVVVYGFKWGIGRTAPGYAGHFFHHPDGASFPSGHVANAVLMWGIARWQVVQFRLPPRVQRLFWLLSVVGPVLTGIAMVSLDFHWVTDAVVGASVGLLLLGVVHALDAAVLSRWVGARTGRPTA